MLKRLLALILCAMVWLCAASAEVVGRTADGRYIQHHLTDNNDQDLYFVSDLEEIEVEKEDYNGDGLTDLAAVTVCAAANIGYQLFVMTEDGQLVPVTLTGGESALFNFDYLPQDGLIISRQQNGLGGLLRKVTLYKWADTDLVMVGQLISDYASATETADDSITAITDLAHIAITVTIFPDNEPKALYQRSDLATEDSESILLALEDAESLLFSLYSGS